MGLFEDAMDELIDTMSSEAGVTLIYHSGGLSTTITDAWVGRTVFRTEDKTHVRLDWEDRDFLIPVGSFVFVPNEVLQEDDLSVLLLESGDSLLLESSTDVNVEQGIVVPERGDWIEQVFESGLVETYELMAPDGEPVWRYSDQQKKLFRVHTKLQRLS